MNDRDIIDLLRGEAKVKNTQIFTVFSNMNVSDQVISDFSNGLHNYKLKAGDNEAQKKILDIFRINPFVAIRIMETCSLDVEELVYAFKIVFLSLDTKKYDGWNNEVLPEDQVILNPHIVPYMSLLIEAAYQNSVCDVYVSKDMFLEYAMEQDLALHRKGGKSKYLNSYNIKHILSHIPDNRQIEFINWFWDRHCYAVSAYGKTETYAGRKVAIMMNELVDGALWRHLESLDQDKLSTEEIQMMNKEKEGIQRFIKNAYEEEHHVNYVQVILGRENFYDKLCYLMGNGYVELFEEKLAIQEVYEIALAEEREYLEEKERLEKERALAVRKEKERLIEYAKLIDRVREKYIQISNGDKIGWHNLKEKKNVQLNLWNYWQGMNFDNVKLMVLGYDWGCVNDSNQEMNECIRKIEIMMKKTRDNHVEYYSCRNKKIDHNIEWLFLKCFNRKIRKQHYSDVYFSNLCLGYRNEATSLLSKETVISDVKDFMLDTLKIINPDVVFCLGENVYELFLKGIGIEEDCDNLDQSIINGTGRKIIVYKMPHCGVAGVKKEPLSKQLERWREVKINMEENGVIL